jgi:hypothetical protein
MVVSSMPELSPPLSFSPAFADAGPGKECKRRVKKKRQTELLPVKVKGVAADCISVPGG